MLINLNDLHLFSGLYESIWFNLNKPKAQLQKIADDINVLPSDIMYHVNTTGLLNDIASIYKLYFETTFDTIVFIHGVDTESETIILEFPNSTDKEETIFNNWYEAILDKPMFEILQVYNPYNGAELLDYHIMYSLTNKTPIEWSNLLNKYIIKNRDGSIHYASPLDKYIHEELEYHITQFGNTLQKDIELHIEPKQKRFQYLLEHQDTVESDPFLDGYLTAVSELSTLIQDQIRKALSC